MTALNHATTHDGNGSVTVTVTGDLDLLTKASLRAHLARILSGPHHAQIILDLHELGFIDASGLGTLIAIQNLAQRRVTMLLLADPPPNLLQIIVIARLEGHFTLAPARRG